ncbi:MAG: thioredoxin family protein [Chitinivibrionales bacterium]|nr:thioredoxin family protein [Chitinivibrionales bacterium]
MKRTHSLKTKTIQTIGTGIFFFIVFGALSTVPQITIDLSTSAPQTSKNLVQTEEPVSVEFSPVDSKGEFILKITLHMKKNVHIYSSEKSFFALKETSSLGLGGSQITLPQSREYKNFDGTIASVYVDGQVITLIKPLLDSTWSISGYLQFQACDSIQCFIPVKKQFSFTSEKATFSSPAPNTKHLSPEQNTDIYSLLSKFTVSGKASGYLDGSAFKAFLQTPTAFSTTKSPFAGKNILFVLLLTIIGGIALNFTPCVLPMIPITLAILGVGKANNNRAKAMATGTVYGGGMAITYGILGCAVILTGTTFGIINASAAFNIAVGIVFIALSLAMFDIIHIDFSKYRSGIFLTSYKKGNFIVTFGMGILAAILAGACVAPVVISVILYSSSLYSSGYWAGLFLPFILGLGMALPWPFAAAGIALLPKPGRWMVWVRNSFGIIICLIAAYYLYTGIRIALPVKNNPTNSTTATSLPWHTSLSEGLTLSLRENKPVFIDFWATWCKNCDAMDATTFQNSDVIKEFSNYILIKYQAENPDDPQTKEILSRFSIIGLPTYLVLERRL